MKIVAIITAGGMGLRLPGKVKKQFRLLDGTPILIHTLKPFLSHKAISEIIITLPQDEMQEFQATINKYIAAREITKPIAFCAGGLKRQDSVYEALKICPVDTDIVLIHDGVRPFVTENLIDALLDMVYDFGAAIPTAPVTNTIKTINGKTIDHTLKREKLLQAYTPQAFGFPLILKCYQKAMTERYYSTDDASLLEHYGYSVHYLQDDSHNLKITDEFDLLVAEQIIKLTKTNKGSGNK